jgi:hypothetical protein
MRLFFLLFSSVAFAAPVPGTTSSLLNSEKPNIFRSSKGFSINAANTKWTLSEPPADLPSIVTVFKSPESHAGLQPVLTVRVDELTHKMILKNYVKQWMRDYPLLGFNVLKAGPLKVGVLNGFLVDVQEAKGEKKLRQIVFLKDQTAVILTCRDRRDTFQKTVKSCNEIFKSFDWGSSPASDQTTF